MQFDAITMCNYSSWFLHGFGGCRCRLQSG